MRIAIGSDHRGYQSKAHIKALLEQWGHEVCDLGVDGQQSVDYPDFAVLVANLVGSGQADRGILICGSGVGMCIVANKIPGIRAANCHDELTAEMSRRHNDVNVLCLAANMFGEHVLERMIQTWLATPFEGGRHARRVEKIMHLERDWKHEPQ